MLLSDLAIRRAKPKEKAYTLNDGNGLSLLIEPNGSKGWRLRYRFAGKPKMLSLGVYPDVSLSDARAARDEAKRLLAGGINPSEARKAQKREQASKFGNTFEGIAREWYEKRIDRWSSSYAEEMIETFEKMFFRTLAVGRSQKLSRWNCWRFFPVLMTVVRLKNCVRFASDVARCSGTQSSPDAPNIIQPLTW